jgi:hypothetical protein
MERYSVRAPSPVGVACSAAPTSRYTAGSSASSARSMMDARFTSTSVRRPSGGGPILLVPAPSLSRLSCSGRRTLSSGLGYRSARNGRHWSASKQVAKPPAGDLGLLLGRIFIFIARLWFEYSRVAYDTWAILHVGCYVSDGVRYAGKLGKQAKATSELGEVVGELPIGWLTETPRVRLVSNTGRAYTGV